jgi:hypothetical protein
MIGHQEIRIGIHHPSQVLLILLKKKSIVFLLYKYILRAICAIVNMVELA